MCGERERERDGGMDRQTDTCQLQGLETIIFPLSTFRPENKYKY